MSDVIDGRAWCRARLTFLRELLKREDLTAQQRSAIESEMDQLHRELGSGWRRWIIGRRSTRPIDLD